MKVEQPWIYSARFDGGLILAPAVVITILVILLHEQIEKLQNIPPWLWLLLIVGIDVSHVYSTIFRTYLDREELKKRQSLYILSPLLAWLVGCFLYSLGSLVFWRVLTYLALFHFIRQQYGFMMIYARKENIISPYHRWLDKAAIYIATIYPVIYWHCYSREFSWFVSGDFIKIDLPFISQLGGVIYVVILSSYVLKEVIYYWQNKTINVPKNLVLFGTAFSWFIGIVAFNNDLVFTATNVIAHGIPYMALIWIYGNNQSSIQKKESSYFFSWIKKFFQGKIVIFYILIVFLLAFIEEGIWDGFIWREHGHIFIFSNILPTIVDTQILMWLIPLLALPQTTHYILDAFIWRLNTKDTNWKQILFYQNSVRLPQK